MLYIFYVDVGKRLTFDMYLVNESVQHLKHVIEEYYHIPANKQVMLISGGECLDDSAKVCNYSSGTDTNPIYLFNRNFLERDDVPCISTDYRSSSKTDAELNQHFENIMSTATPATIYTINKINQLAQKYLEQALETKAHCDQMNSDQLLQQQGWAAAIANLEDVLENFSCQCDAFDSAYRRYLETRQENIDLINSFLREDLTLLSRIPLLPALLDGNDEERARLEMCCDKSKPSDLTLLHWISAKEPDQSLENLVMNCKLALDEYDEHSLISLQEDIKNLFHPNRLKSLRNINDMSQKLMVLSGLIVTIKDAQEDQAKKASGIKRNHDRALELKEDCVLQDLVETHQDTLRLMKDNYQNLRSCRQLCLQCKKELCDITHYRLKNIMNMQVQAAEIQSILVLHCGALRRIRDSVEIIKQLHTTPQNYFAAVSEVVRRRSYSQAFLMWASDLACRIFAIYTEETERRKKFMAQFEGHFLNSLFPGLEDVPPRFATQSPPLFDNNLPALCDDDLYLLCENLPDLKDRIELPNVDAVRDFFLSKSLTLSEIDCQDEIEEKTNENSVNEKLTVVMTVAGINGYSSSFSKNNAPVQDMITSSDSNYCTQNSTSRMDSTKKIDKSSHENDVQIMREKMTILGTLTHNTVVSLRDDLSDLRNWMYSRQSEIGSTVQILYEQTQQQQTHIQNLLLLQKSKDDTIKSLLTKISDMEIEKAKKKIIELSTEEELRENFEKERDEAIKEATERLTRDHRHELEVLRQRFKLVACANTERFSSENDLDKMESNELIELNVHKSMISRLRFDMEIQFREILEEERANYARKLESEYKRFENDKQLLEHSLRAEISGEFEKQIENMRIRESTLLAELQRHKDTIHTLTGPDSGGCNSLMNRIEELESEKIRLQSELIKERQLKYACNTSQCSSIPVIIGELSGSATSLCNSSPELPQNISTYKIAYKKSHGSPNHAAQSKICLETCNVGDAVLIVWDDTQRNYTILQNSNTLHFLHPTSLDNLGLRPASDGSPRKLYCPAEVTEKEYCAPKKKVNRYNLKEGERFYRVKARPLKSAIRKP